MVELVDTLDLKSNDHCGRAGSSPAPGTLIQPRITFGAFFLNRTNLQENVNKEL